MLQSIRDKSSSWIVWVIIGLIVAAFALTGFGGLGGFGSETKVADFDGLEYYQRGFKQDYQNYLNETGKFDNEETRKEAFEVLIDQAAYRPWVEKSGFVAPDKVWLAKLAEMPMFQDEAGNFSESKYHSILKGANQNAAEYEAGFAEQVRYAQVAESLAASAFVLPFEVDSHAVAQSQQREINLIKLTVDSELGKQEVSETELQAYYDANQAKYMQPERIRVKYLELTLADVTNKVKADDAVIAAHYDATKGEYLQPESRSATIVKVKAESKDEEGFAKAKEAARALYDKIKEGADMAALEGHPATTTTYKLSETLPENEFVFSVEKEGTLIEPLRLGDTYAVIRVDKINKESIQPLADVKTQVINSYRKKAARDNFDKAIKAIDDLAVAGKRDLEALTKAGEAQGLSVKTSDWFTRDSGTGIANNKDVRSEAFQSTVLEANENSSPIYFGDQDKATRVVFIRKDEHEEEKVKPLAEVKFQVEIAAKKQKAIDAVAAAANQIMSAAEAGKLAEKLTELKVQKTELGSVTRTDFSKLPIDVSNAAFAMSKPTDGPRYKTLERGDDRYIIELVGVTKGKKSEDVLTNTAIQNGLLDAMRAREFVDFRTAARHAADFDLYPDEAFED